MKINNNCICKAYSQSQPLNAQKVAFKGFERIIMNGEQYSEELMQNVIKPYVAKKANGESVIGFSGGPCIKLMSDILDEVSKITKRSPHWFIANIKGNNLHVPEDFRVNKTLPFNLIYGDKDVKQYLKFALRRLCVDKLICKYHLLFAPRRLPRESRVVYANFKLYESNKNAFDKYMNNHGVVFRDISEIQAEMSAKKQ